MSKTCQGLMVNFTLGSFLQYIQRTLILWKVRVMDTFIMAVTSASVTKVFNHSVLNGSTLILSCDIMIFML